MTKICLFAWIIACSFFAQSQYNVEWSELVKIKGSTTGILPISGADFYTTRWQGGLFGSMYMGKHVNFQMVQSGKIQSVVGNSLASYEGVATVKGQLVVFLSDKKEGKHLLYMQKYNTDCKPDGKPIELTSYTMPSTWKRKGYFNIISSRNGEFLCIEYDIPGSKETSQKYGYKVLSDSLEIVSEGEYESPYDPQLSEVSNRYLSNTGDYFLACKIYDVNDKGRVKDYTTLQKAILVQVTPEGLNEFELDLDGKRIYDMGFSSDNNRIMTFTGLYGDAERGNTGIKGIFYFRLDFNEKEIIDDGFEKFDKDFITEGWSQKEREKADKREAKGKPAPQLFNYDIRESVTLGDGSVIGMLEQYYVQQVSSNDPRTGTNSVTYYYYYNNLIVYKIQPNGTFDWVKNIPKYQVSANDNGYYSSVGRFVTDDKMVIFFNDNLKNYDAQGMWNSYIEPASYRKKSNTVAKVEVNLQDGSIDRRTFFDRSETDAIAIPKLFKTDYKNQQMLMLLIYGKKEKYGLLNFKE